MNDWSPSEGWTAVAHTRNGTGGFHANTGGVTADELRSAGGNVAYLDGSVQWRRLNEMQVHNTFSATSGDFFGMW